MNQFPADGILCRAVYHGEERGGCYNFAYREVTVKMYRITWVSKITGFKGHGDAAFSSYVECMEICTEMNRKFPEIDHCPEEACT